MKKNTINNLNKFGTVSAVAILACFAASNIATAQEPAQTAEAPTIVLDEITIYGAKDTNSLQDTSSSVGIVTSDDILNSAIQSYPEAFRRLANVSDGDWNDSGFIIRGVSSEGLVAGSAPLASLYIDGVQQTVNGARRGARGLWDVEQMEVYRGPQSTLSGRAALAGAIYIKTKDPTFKKELELSTTVGTDSLVGTAFMVNMPIIDNQVAVRIAGEFERSKNDINYPSFENYDRYDDFIRDEYYQIRGKVLFQPDELPDTKALFSYSFSHDSPYSRDIGGPLIGFDYDDERGDHNGGVFTEDRSSDNHNVGLEVTHDISDSLRFTSMTGFTYTSTDRPSVKKAGEDGDVSAMEGNYHDRLITQELRLNYEADKWKWVAGLYGSYENSDGYYSRDTVRGGALQNDFSRTKNKTGNLAVFGEATYEFVPTWKITAGGRLDYTTQDISQFLQRTPSTDAPSQPIDDSFNETVFLPKVGLSKELNENHTVGITYSQGFRSGGAGVDQNPETEPEDRAYTYGSETASTYELYYKGLFLNDTLRLNANVFYTKYKDQQIEVGQAPFTKILNAASSESWGFEIEPTYDITSNWSAFASLGYVDTKFLDAETIIAGAPQDLKGKPFPDAPKWSVGLGSRYKFDNGLYVGADAKYTSGALSRFGNFIPFTYLDSRWIVNMQAGYKIGHWEINAFAENLLDEKYFVFEEKDVAATLGEGRKFGLNVKAKF